MPQLSKKSRKNKKKISEEMTHHLEIEKIIKSKAHLEIFENEEASIQDKSYTFDDDNTGDEDIHLISDFELPSEID